MALFKLIKSIFASEYARKCLEIERKYPEAWRRLQKETSSETQKRFKPLPLGRDHDGMSGENYDADYRVRFIWENVTESKLEKLEKGKSTVSLELVATEDESIAEVEFIRTVSYSSKEYWHYMDTNYSTQWNEKWFGLIKVKSVVKL